MQKTQNKQKEAGKGPFWLKNQILFNTEEELWFAIPSYYVQAWIITYLTVTPTN